LAAYESGRVDPSVETLERIVRAAGYSLTATLRPLLAPDDERAREIVDVLELAEHLPARPRPALEYPLFGAA
jgi:transcriptional regulator with XRE-family HTH domain